MDPLDVAGLGVDAFKLGYNLFTNQRDFDYQKALQQQIFQREDTAVQRRMADLKAAGINPNLAAGSAAGAGSVVSRSNTNDLGSALDTVQALNSIKQQRQAVKNAQVEQDILKHKEIQEYNNMMASQMELLAAMGIPIKSYIHGFGNNYYLSVQPDTDKNNYEGYFDLASSPFQKMFNWNMQNQKNSADLLQRDVDWYTADKISGLTFGLFGLGNSASGWRKLFGK